MTKTKFRSPKPLNTAGKAASDADKRKPTKANAVLDLLRSKNGASIEELTTATGWQAHSVRGFLSGTVKKRMGLTVENEPDKEGVRRYRIVADKAATATATTTAG